MLAGILLLVLGGLCGMILRVPAFIMLNAVALAIYGWILRGESVAHIGAHLLIGFLAIQCGYASTILAQLLVSRMRERVGHASEDNRCQ